MGAGNQSAVMMEAEAATAFMVIQASLSLELASVEFGHPAHLGQAGDPFGLRAFRKVRDLVVRGRFFSLWLPANDPLGAGREMVALYRVCDHHPAPGEAATDLFPQGGMTWEDLEGRRRTLFGQGAYRLGAPVGPEDRGRPRAAGRASPCARGHSRRSLVQTPRYPPRRPPRRRG